MQTAGKGYICARGAADIAYIAYAAAVSESKWTCALLAALASAAGWRMTDSNSQILAKTTWAFATVHQKDEHLFTALAAAAGRRMKDFNSKELANTAWAFAEVDKQDEQLFTALAAVPPFSVAWAISTVPGCVSHFFGMHISIIFQD